MASAGAAALPWVEAMDGAHEALAAQHLVAAGDAAGEVVGDVEEHGVAVGDHAVERQQVLGYRAAADAGVDLLEQRHRRFHPHAPVAEQAALEAQRRLSAAVADGERRHQVGDDVVVVAGVEGDALLGAGRRPRRRPRPASCSG